MKQIAATILLAILMYGCATTPEIPMSGQTVATGKLKSDVFNMLPTYASLNSGCRRPIQSIRTEIEKAPSEVVSNSSDQVIKGTVVEKWTLSMCGKEEVVFLTFTPDGKGGSYIRFSRSLDNDS